MGIDGKWMYNDTDNEYWMNEGYDTREEAEAAGISHARESGAKTILIGQTETILLRTDVDADHILEYLNELYTDESRGEDYIYESVSDEDKKWLEDELSSLMVKFHKRAGIKPIWYKIINDYEIDIDGETCFE